ncbi:MAG: glycosyltransferase family 4 protein [Anaerolineae bacterium]
MKTAIFVVAALYEDWHTAISGHVQTSLKTAEILVKQGHEVTFITTGTPSDGRVPLPAEISRRVGTVTIDVPMTAGGAKAPGVRAAMRLMLELRRLVRAGAFDLLHCFGGSFTAYLAGLLRATGVRTPTLMTVVRYTRPDHRWEQVLEMVALPRVDRFVALCDWTRQQLVERGIRDVFVTYPGILTQPASRPNKQIRIRADATDLVLFWRDASLINGVDVCMEAFKTLSDDFPLVDFVFAVRVGHPFDDALRKLANQYDNIHVLFFPYAKEGFAISQLIASASCVVLPFRSLNCDPQMAVLETMASGAFLITTPVGSNREVLGGYDGATLVRPADVEDTCQAIRRALHDREARKSMGQNTNPDVLARWNWDGYERELMGVYRDLLGTRKTATVGETAKSERV